MIVHGAWYESGRRRARRGKAGEGEIIKITNQKGSEKDTCIAETKHSILKKKGQA